MREALRICIVRRDADDARADRLWGEIAAALGDQPFEIEKVPPPSPPAKLPDAALTILVLPPLDPQNTELVVFAGLMLAARGEVVAVEANGARHLREDDSPVYRKAWAFGPMPVSLMPSVDPAVALAHRLVPRAKGPAGPPLFYGFVSSPPEDPPATVGPSRPFADPSTPESENRPDIHLNAWFEEDQARLVVGRAARLCVNLGPERAKTESSASEALSDEAVKAMEDLEYVDVLVTARWADVARPWRKSLSMPPEPARVLLWEITPRRAGKIEISVVLAIRNEPIHEMAFSVDAVDATVEAGARAS